MAGFHEIVGHEQLIAHLQSAIVMDKVSHAYIINGPKDSGKMMLAEAFAMALQCETSIKNREGLAGQSREALHPETIAEPCMECHSCKQALNKNQPDIIYLTHEKPNTISVADIREQINHDIEIKPYSSKYKVYIVDEAEKMNQQAQNALLKTIEEPPTYAVILLLTRNAEALLPTISSRCVKLKLKAVSDAMIKNYLIDTCHLPDYQAEMDAAFAQGSVGKAQKIDTSEEFARVREHALRIVKYSKDMPMQELVETMKRLAQEKETIYDYLDLFLLWFRDVLLFKATWEVDNLVFKQEINAIKERASSSSYEGLEAIIKAIEKAKSRLHANVNFDLTMELLFLTIREN